MFCDGIQLHTELGVCFDKSNQVKMSELITPVYISVFLIMFPMCQTVWVY